MNETAALIQSDEGVLATLLAVAAFWFWVERATRAKLFEYVPPLIFIYFTPVVLNNTGVIPPASPVYGALGTFALPMFITLMLLGINVGAAVRVMGKGVMVMLLGTVGIVLGAPIGYFVVHRWLEPDAWQGFGALAGSWIGGTGNMAAMEAALGTSAEQMGLAVVADNAIYIIWLPILLGSRVFAKKFNAWAKVPEDRIAKMEAAAAAEVKDERAPKMVDYLNLLVVAVGVTWVSATLAPYIPEVVLGGREVISTGTWKILIITTLGIGLSLTKLRHIPGSHELAMALVYVFVARMGARSSLEGLSQAPAFLLGAFIWIMVHGAFCLLGARLFKVDVHSVAIASAANVGGAASAPIVAAAHRESLVPVSILMALLGYAIGNYAAIIAANLCRFVGGG